MGKRGYISVFKSVFLTAKITSEFYKKSDPKNFLNCSRWIFCDKNKWRCMYVGMRYTTIYLCGHLMG
jgi:hypothetical protein